MTETEQYTIYYIYRDDKLVTKFTGTLEQAQQYATDQNMVIGEAPTEQGDG